MPDCDKSRKEHQKPIPVGIRGQNLGKQCGQKESEIQHAGNDAGEKVIPSDQPGQSREAQHQKAHIVYDASFRKIQKSGRNRQANATEQEKRMKDPHDL